MSDRGEPRPGRPGKGAGAYRTIGEVAEDLDLPPHVLRFWEAKFPQLKPLKRGGGRRYYRPEDVDLLRHIRRCLYQDGYTIRGVQKLLGTAADAAPPDEPGLFPLEAARAIDEPPLRRPRRAALEEARRELLDARALLEELLRRR